MSKKIAHFNCLPNEQSDSYQKALMNALNLAHTAQTGAIKKKENKKFFVVYALEQKKELVRGSITTTTQKSRFEVKFEKKKSML